MARASTNLDISLPLFRKLIRLTPRPTVFTTWCGTDDELLVGATGEVPVAHQLRLRTLAENGFTDAQLQRIKAEQETAFYYNIESILNKALQLYLK